MRTHHLSIALLLLLALVGCSGAEPLPTQPTAEVEDKTEEAVVEEELSAEAPLRSASGAALVAPPAHAVGDEGCQVGAALHPFGATFDHEGARCGCDQAGVTCVEGVSGACFGPRTGGWHPEGSRVLDKEGCNTCLCSAGKLSPCTIKDCTISIRERIVFTKGKATLLNPDAVASILDGIAAVLKELTDLKVEVQGYVDVTEIKGEKAQLKLSIKRAEVVRDALVARGVPAERLEVRGFGADHPGEDASKARGEARSRIVARNGAVRFKVLEGK